MEAPASIRLEDIIPQPASFTLRKTGKTYHLNPVSLDDELWMSHTFGADLETVFRDIKMKEICRIVFRLLSDEDKEEFLAKDVTIINEQGEKNKIRRGGAELLYLIISGYAEKLEIFYALMNTLGLSRPVQEKLQAQAEKKSQSTEPTGQKSSISSPMNTAGRPKKSSKGQRGKSSSASRPSVSAGISP